MRILVITNWLPFPPNEGLRLRTYNLLQRIGREHEVWLASVVRSVEEAEGVSHLLPFCKGVETVQIEEESALSRPVELFRYLLSGTPPDLRLHMHTKLIQQVQSLVERIDFDIVNIVDSYMGLYEQALPRDMSYKTVLEFIDVVYRKYDRMYRLEPKMNRKIRLWLHSVMMRWWEPRYAERFDHCIAVSEVDRQALRTANPRLMVDVVPNGVDTRLYQPLPFGGSQPVLLFVGNMNYRPNVDAVLHFHRSILPRIQHAIPATQLHIVGKDPGAEIKQLAGNGVDVIGSVEDLQPYYRQSTVCIVPLRAGSGTRLKILEAMALGRPVVSTSLGCEGLDVIDGEHLLIADTAEEFAEKVALLLNDEPLRHRIVSSARQFVVSRYDWDVLAAKLIQIYSELVT